MRRRKQRRKKITVSAWLCEPWRDIGSSVTATFFFTGLRAYGKGKEQRRKTEEMKLKWDRREGGGDEDENECRRSSIGIEGENTWKEERWKEWKEVEGGGGGGDEVEGGKYLELEVGEEVARRVFGNLPRSPFDILRLVDTTAPLRLTLALREDGR